jgi:hypothetical protein
MLARGRYGNIVSCCQHFPRFSRLWNAISIVLAASNSYKAEIHVGRGLLRWFLVRAPRISQNCLSRDANQIADTACSTSLCICGILRIYYVDRLYYKTYDTTWEAQPAWLWLIVEANLAVICASAPALKVFFKTTLEPPSSDYAVRGTPSGKQSKSSLKELEPSMMEQGTTKGTIKMTWEVSAVNESNTSLVSTRRHF